MVTNAGLCGIESPAPIDVLRKSAANDACEVGEDEMALKVVGSGLGRTGTMSLKLALEQLGFTKCYHMVEVFMNPPHAGLWIAAAEGNPQWDKLFEGYAATVDYPGAAYWKQIWQHYPDSKVLHSVRDPEKWFESTQATIFSPQSPARQKALPPEMQKFFGSVLGEFGAKINNKTFMIDHFKRHTDDVIKTVPSDRLLVYEASQGWEPLCRFLGVPVPSTPFPRENSREQFIGRMQAGQTQTIEAMQERIQKELHRPG